MANYAYNSELNNLISTLPCGMFSNKVISDALKKIEKHIVYIKEHDNLDWDWDSQISVIILAYPHMIKAVLTIFEERLQLLSTTSAMNLHYPKWQTVPLVTFRKDVDDLVSQHISFK